MNTPVIIRIMIIPAYIYNYPAFWGSKKHLMPTDIGWKYYISWEDALWDLLKAKNVPKDAVVLMPSYHCLDVMNNIDDHGYKCVTYEVDRDFKTTPEKILSLVNERNAKVIVIFHTQGINNDLMKDTSWMEKLPKDVLIIEDAVHHLLKPKDVKIVSNNHFLIDSQRKVTPLTGSFIYGTKEAMNYEKEKWSSAFLYEAQCIFWHIFYQFLWWLGYTIQSKWVIEQGEKILTIHDDLIGDSKRSGHNSTLFKWLYQHIDFEKVYRIKEKQVEVYFQRIGTILRTNPAFFLPHFEKDNAKQLRNFPVGLNIDYADGVLKFFREHGLLIPYLLNQSEWAQKQKLITLPVGPHITLKHSNFVCDLVEKYDKEFPNRSYTS